MRSIIRERAHHTVEVLLYPALEGKRELGLEVGCQVRMLLDVWLERGLPRTLPDIRWAEDLLTAVDLVRDGQKPDLDTISPRQFSVEEMGVVNELVFSRRSIRQFTDEEIEDDLVEKILLAGQWAPHACNLQSLRFLVLKTGEELSLIRLDIRGHKVLIVACQDSRVYQANPHVPLHNRLLDCGAAMQNMVLMAHALGLGACWGTFREHQTKNLRQHFAVQDFIDIVTCVALGWPDEEVVPPPRIDLSEAIIRPPGSPDSTSG